MVKIELILCLLFCMCFTSLFSQEKIVNEANAANQQNQSEAIILYQQQFLDSVLKERLRNDLLHANGNDMKTIELEKMIAKIETEDSLRKVELLKKIDYLKKNVKGAGVVPFQDTLFYLHARAASYDPEERAANIKKRILIPSSTLTQLCSSKLKMAPKYLTKTRQL
jgi:hypothetical protein